MSMGDKHEKKGRGRVGNSDLIQKKAQSKQQLKFYNLWGNTGAPLHSLLQGEPTTPQPQVLATHSDGRRRLPNVCSQAGSGLPRFHQGLHTESAGSEGGPELGDTVVEGSPPEFMTPLA